MAIEHRGYTKDGKYDGPGELWSNGNLLGHGQFVGTTPKGMFHFVYPDGNVWIGETSASPNGLGVFFYSNGDVYAGRMFGFEKKGQGVLIRKKPIPIVQKKIEMGFWDNDRLLKKIDDLSSYDKKGLRDIERRLESFTGSDQRIQQHSLHYGEGIGVWVSKDGHLLTPTRTVCWGKIRIGGSKHFKARVIAEDEELQLSLVKVEHSPKTVVSLGSASTSSGNCVVCSTLNSKFDGRVTTDNQHEIQVDSDLAGFVCNGVEGCVLVDETGRFLSIGVARRNNTEIIFNQSVDFSSVVFPTSSRISDFLGKNGVVLSDDEEIKPIQDCLVEVGSNFGFD